MDTSLFDFVIEEPCAVVHFLWAERDKPAEIHLQMPVQYGGHSIN